MRHAYPTSIAAVLLLASFACGGESATSPSAASSTSAPVTLTPAAPPDLRSGPITFSDLASGSPVVSYSESGFTVRVTSANWEAFGYGNPRSSIIFWSPGGTNASGTIEVTGGGGTFSFTSVDVYSSTTPIPHTIVGLRSSAPVFTLSGTVPNTFGNFRMVGNPDAAAVIDTLRITLTNAAAPCCRNPMGVDNITLQVR